MPEDIERASSLRPHEKRRNFSRGLGRYESVFSGLGGHALTLSSAMTHDHERLSPDSLARSRSARAPAHRATDAATVDLAARARASPDVLVREESDSIRILRREQLVRNGALEDRALRSGRHGPGRALCHGHSESCHARRSFRATHRVPPLGIRPREPDSVAVRERLTQHQHPHDFPGLPLQRSAAHQGLAGSVPAQRHHRIRQLRHTVGGLRAPGGQPGPHQAACISRNGDPRPTARGTPRERARQRLLRVALLPALFQPCCCSTASR